MQPPHFNGISVFKEAITEIVLVANTPTRFLTSTSQFVGLWRGPARSQKMAHMILASPLLVNKKTSQSDQNYYNGQWHQNNECLNREHHQKHNSPCVFLDYFALWTHVFSKNPVQTHT